MRLLIAFVTVLVWQTIALGQLTVQDKYDPYKPIVAGCNCIIPENGQVQFMWQVDATSFSIPSDDNKKLYIWAPPGPHTVEAVVVTEVFKDMLVWVPDPTAPNDITKAHTEKVKTLVSFDVQRYQKSYVVLGSPGPGPGPPGPPPGPGPGPGPLPTDDFATQAMAWLKAIPAASYSKDKAIGVANNYAAVAAQAAATSGWDLSAFVNTVKQKNQETVGTDNLAAWGPVFFNPLAVYQQKLFNERKLTTTDVPGLVKLWKDTAEAITKAATAIGFSESSGQLPQMHGTTAEDPAQLRNAQLRKVK